MIKIMRMFFGGYVADPVKLNDMRVYALNIPRPLITISTVDHGFGQIKGSTKKIGENYSSVSVCVFKRSNRQFLWEAKSKADGSYQLRNIAKGLECFVVAFDPSGEYNAVISDNVVPK